jgi:hypothetical protein
MSLNRSQLKIMLGLRKRKNTLFSMVPKELILQMASMSHAGHEDLIKLFKAITCNKLEDVKSILNEKPALLFFAGNVTDPLGNEIKCIAPYEYAICIGNEVIVNTIGTYFAKIGKDIKESETERLTQYKRYEPSFKRMYEMLKSFSIDSDKPVLGSDFDFLKLVDTLKKSTTAEVAHAALGQKENKNESNLDKELTKLHLHFKPREIQKGMNVNYANLFEAYRVYLRERGNLPTDAADILARLVTTIEAYHLSKDDKEAMFSYGRSGVADFIKSSKATVVTASQIDFFDNFSSPSFFEAQEVTLFKDFMVNKFGKLLAAGIQPPQQDDSPSCTIC